MSITGVTNNQQVYGASATNSSTKTEDYLNTLKEKYPDVNITVASLNDKQLEKFAFGSIGTFNNFTISKNILEKMANDPKTAEKYEALISKIPEDSEYAKKFAEDNGIKLLAFGMNVDKNGKANYWGLGTSDKKYGTDGPTMTQRMQKDAAESAAKKKEAQKQEEVRQKKLDEKELLEKGGKTHFFSAESTSKLTEKMKAAHGESKSFSGSGIDVKA